VHYAPCGCSPLGKLSQQSQPYAPVGSDAWTVYHYDASGRTTSVVLPDNSTTTYQYQGNVATVTDPASKYKVFTMDCGHRTSSELNAWRAMTEDHVYYNCRRSMALFRLSLIKDQLPVPPRLTKESRPQT